MALTMLGRGRNAGEKACKACKRSFATTLNPCVHNPAATDLLKPTSKGSLVCSSCYQYLLVDEDTADLRTQDAILWINEDLANQVKYDAGQGNYEARRRDGHRTKRALSSTSSRGKTAVKGVKTTGIETRQLLGCSTFIKSTLLLLPTICACV